MRFPNFGRGVYCKISQARRELIRSLNEGSISGLKTLHDKGGRKKGFELRISSQTFLGRGSSCKTLQDGMSSNSSDFSERASPHALSRKTSTSQVKHKSWYPSLLFFSRKKKKDLSWRSSGYPGSTDPLSFPNEITALATGLQEKPTRIYETSKENRWKTLDWQIDWIWARTVHQCSYGNAVYVASPVLLSHWHLI